MTKLDLLPIDSYLPQILDLLKKNSNLVVTAAPGAGKTTRLPAAIAKAFSKKTLVLEPRRMAAIAAAHRIAEEQSWQLGEQVGYQVRFANKTSPKTKLVFMTEALLARQMIEDPELSDVDVVILDEFHERSSHVDLALGLLKELQDLGRDIKLVVMSATLEAQRISEYLGSCPVISVPGKLFELEIRHQKNSQVLMTSTAFFEQLVQTVKQAQNQTEKDILVFLPGVGEIEKALQNLAPWAQTKNIQLVPLHGSLPLEEQRRALQKTSLQRVILSTNIAESSVTLEGVNTVIDSGLAKVMKQDHRTGFSRLELTRISHSSITQRSGRAARQFPGIAYRMWNKHDELAFAKNETPEIQRIDLSESLLFLSAQGVTDFESFNWFEKPSPTAIQSGVQFLKISGAIDERNRITPLGRNMLHFPLPVRLAKLMLVGIQGQNISVASDLAALLQERDILRRDASLEFLGDELENDLEARWQVLDQFRKTKKVPTHSSFMALQTVDQSARQISQLATKINTTVTSTEKADEQEILIKTFVDRLCRRRAKSERALMVGGRGVKLSPESLVKKSEFFVALSGLDTDSETTVSLACGFDKNFVLRMFKENIVKVQDVTFVEDKGQFFTREYRSLFGLPLDEPSLSVASQEEVTQKLPLILTERFDYALKSNESLSRWWHRYQFLKRHQQNLPPFSEEEFILQAFTQACMGESKLQTVVEKDLIFFFENTFPPEIVETLRKELPDKIQVPSGSQIIVHYPTDKPPFLEVRIQEVFGMMQTPKVLFQKLPVTFHLLGPNFRPVQVTSDLESFWKNAYPEVRKELRLKYPKHQWPEDPADGTPEAKGRRRF